MYTVEQKIEHLKSLGITEDLGEVYKLYNGQEFNLNDLGYKKLLELSKTYCVRFTELSSIISKEKDENRIAELSKEKSDILDKLFPGHGLIFGGGDGLFAIIGMADLDGFNYLNARVHFNPSALTHLEEYAFIASNVEFGNANIQSENGKGKAGRIIVGRDSWIGADVKFEDNTVVGARSVIGMGSHIVENTRLKPEMISFGNPCSEYRKIPEDYDTPVKKPADKYIIAKDEVQYIIEHLKKLGINGDFTQYIRALTLEKYNTLEATISQIYELSHKLCSEYNSGDISIRRRKEILDMIFPIHGNNLVVGDDIFIDCIGTVRIGNDVSIGNRPTIAGNVLIGDGVKIGNSVTLQTTGHEINYKGRILTQDSEGNYCEISTPGYIIIEPQLILADGTKVIPDKTLKRNTEENEVITR